MWSGVFSVPWIYLETYIYDEVYVRILMTSYVGTFVHSVRSRYIVSQRQNISFLHNFRKSTFFSKLQVVSETAPSERQEKYTKEEKGRQLIGGEIV